MSFKHRINNRIFILRRGNQAIDLIIRPIDIQIRGVGNKPIFKTVILMISDQLVAHAWPGNMFDPGGMGVEDLSCGGSHPFRHAFVVLWCRIDLPSHLHEHTKQHGDLFGEVGDVGEFADDVGHELGEGVENVGVVGAGVKEGGDRWVRGVE